jgi:hypothetical protein
MNTVESPEFLQRLQQTGDFDVTKAVREILVRTNTSEESLTFYDNSCDIRSSEGKAPEVQIYYQKRFWIHQLIALNNVNTMEDRLLINQFVVPQDWFTYFANNVVDLANIHGLPKANGW